MFDDGTISNTAAYLTISCSVGDLRLLSISDRYDLEMPSFGALRLTGYMDDVTILGERAPTSVLWHWQRFTN